MFSIGSGGYFKNLYRHKRGIGYRQQRRRGSAATYQTSSRRGNDLLKRNADPRLSRSSFDSGVLNTVEAEDGGHISLRGAYL